MKTFKLLSLFLFLTTIAAAQNFLEPTEGFSTKKDAYITLKDGKEVVGQFRGTKRKKGLFLSITIKNGKGDKVTYQADQIKHMYLPASGWDKFAKSYESFYDATDWNDDTSLNQSYLKDGYAFFESVTTQVKKKTRVALLQVLNPAYCQKVRIYNNPWAGETASLGIAGFKVAGGDSKSYYVKGTQNEKAFLLMKKNYDDEFKSLYGDCKSFLAKYKKIKWADIEEHVYEHAKACNKA